MGLPPSYALRSLAARPGRSLLAASVIALVIVATTLLLGLMSGLERTLVTSGDPLNLVVLRKGSDNDGSSQLSLAAYQSIRFLDEIARDAAGQPLASPQLVVQPFLYRVGGGRENVLVRGLDRVALEVHPRVQIERGRMFEPSSGEVVIGSALVGRYEGAELGGSLRFGRGRWRVVGILSAQGASFESEIWADAHELARDTRRPMAYSGARVRARSAADLEPLAARIAADPRHALEAKRETEYYADQAESSATLRILVWAIAVLAGMGAGFGAANTLYASVASRIAEIGTLRALGFSRGSILRSFELEALLLGLAGFALGAPLSLGAAAWLGRALQGVAFGASTFTSNVVAVRVAPGDLAVAAGLALAIGALAGLGPAWRAARMRPVDALRRAGE